MADAEPKKEEKKKDSKEHGGSWLGEIIAAAGTAVVPAALAAIATVQAGGIGEVRVAAANLADDLSMVYHTRGTNRAIRWVWWCQFWVWFVLALLIAAYFTTGLFLAKAWTIIGFLMGAAGVAALQAYAWPVKGIGFAEHRRERYLLDEARRKLRELEALRESGAPSPRPGTDLGTLIDEAEADVGDKQVVYNQFLHDKGEQDRDPIFILKWGEILSIFMGFMLLFGVIARHVDGTYTYEEVWPYVLTVCVIPFTIFIIPLFVLYLVAPWAFSQVAKGEDLLTITRRLAKAAVIVGEGYTDIVREELFAQRLNGDDVNRNSTQIAKQRFMAALGTLLIKVVLAALLYCYHALFFPNTFAFVATIIWGTFLVGFQAVRERWNRNQEDPPWIVTTLGIVGMIAIYAHAFLAGGAPQGYRGLGWWWSDYGPFASPAAHAVSRTVHHAHEAVAPTAATYSTAIGHTTIESFFKVLAIIVVVVGAALLAFRYGSLLLKKTEDVWMKRFALLIAAPAAAVLIVLGLALVLKAPVDTTRTDTQSTPHSVTTEAGNLGSQARRSVGLGLGEGAQALDEANDQREADLDRRAWCQLDGAGHTRCTEQCFQLHGKDPQTVPDERSAGNCYDRQQ